MTEIVKLKTGSKFEDHGSYSRLVAVDNLIFVSNTAGRNPRTKLIPEDLAEQTRQVLANIETALKAVDSCLEDVVRARVFVQFTDDIDTIMTAYGERMRGINPTLTMTCPPLGSTEYKVEIDVTAYRGASKAEIKEMVITP
ncbi:Rid family hydrolase [Sagittula stellata]|uniref:Putative translation initiation inhibitor n=1 Tax=Sagittula stellata (strain ATCC 700073 / DSM 11524 / E-37) TaxID=388399 RepID=A3K7U8_SAGS3|nr:Rid family hydrolase [Sagittula stellata]EBA06720.1 putative translation initiation inhibitor [Sagittula stellata E-37]